MLTEETEELFPNEFLLPSLDEAAAVFRREGIKTELAIGSKQPGIELIKQLILAAQAADRC